MRVILFDKIIHYLNIFAWGEAHEKSLTVFVANGLVYPFLLFTFSLSFNVFPCGGILPLSTFHYRCLAGALWVIYLAIVVGDAWHSKFTMGGAIIANLLFFIWGCVVLVRAVSNDTFSVPVTSCNVCAKLHFLCWFIIPHILACRLYVTVRQNLATRGRQQMERKSKARKAEKSKAADERKTDKLPATEPSSARLPEEDTGVEDEGGAKTLRTSINRGSPGRKLVNTGDTPTARQEPASENG